MIKTGPLIIAASLIYLIGIKSSLAHGTHDELLTQVSLEIKAQPENHRVLLERAKLQLKQGNNDLALRDIEAA